MFSTRWRGCLFSGARLFLAFLVLMPSPLWANPSGGSVVSGAATILNSGSTLTVQQQSNYAIINWQNFSINAGQLTQFIQPSAVSAALNRVTGANPGASS